MGVRILWVNIHALHGRYMSFDRCLNEIERVGVFDECVGLLWSGPDFRLQARLVSRKGASCSFNVRPPCARQTSWWQSKMEMAVGVGRERQDTSGPPAMRVAARPCRWTHRSDANGAVLVESGVPASDWRRQSWASSRMFLGFGVRMRPCRGLRRVLV